MSKPLPKIKHFSVRHEINKAIALDPELQLAVDLVGYPQSRRRSADYATLAQIINAQQLSTHAAAAIWDRLESDCRGQVSPRKILNRGPENLKRLGLSRMKSEYLIDSRN